MLTKTSASRYKTVLNAARPSLQIATGGGNEITSVLVTGGSGGAAARRPGDCTPSASLFPDLRGRPFPGVLCLWEHDLDQRQDGRGIRC